MALSRADQRAFDAAQQDQSFLAWVEMNEILLDEAIHDVVPGLPGRPWGPEALLVAEARALELFPSMEETFDADHQEQAWMFVRLLGQTFVDAFDGTWVNLPPSGSSTGGLAVDTPARTTFHLEPKSLVTAAMKRRTGEEWHFVFTRQAEKHAALRARDDRPG